MRGWLKIKTAPSRIPFWASVVDAGKADAPGRNNWYRAATRSPDRSAPRSSRMSMIDGIRVATGTEAGRAKSTTEVPA